MILADMGGCFDLDQRFIFDKIADDKHRHCREVAPHDAPIGLSDLALVCQVFRLVLHIPCQADIGCRPCVILHNRFVTGEER